MTTVTIRLPDEKVRKLHELAEQAGKSPEEFLEASVAEWLGGTQAEFQNAADHVLQKNAELYRRLA